jgi:hypothetical protein
VLEANLAPLRALSRLSRRVVISSPVFTKYAEIHGFIARNGLASLGIMPAFEVMDYTAEQSARWGLPLKAWERAFLPAARLWSRLYYRAWGPRIPYLVMQERTALAWEARPGTAIICWTRDEPLPVVPESCLISERARPGGQVSASARDRAPGRPPAG